jgi:isoquinoline 1-oxidoreductase alpha subunit
MTEIHINGKLYKVSLPGDIPLLWVIREHIGLTGTKFGCGKGICGACTVLLEEEPIRSCITPLKEVKGPNYIKTLL